MATKTPAGFYIVPRRLEPAPLTAYVDLTLQMS